MTSPPTETMTLRDCPPGLFRFGGTLCFKSEYQTENSQGYLCDAYVVSSGEFFWGGTDNNKDRATLLVTPVEQPGESGCVEVLRTTEEVIGRVTLHRRIFDGMPGYLRELEECLVAARRALRGVQSSDETSKALERDRRVFGSSYERVDADGSRHRLDPTTVHIGSVPEPGTQPVRPDHAEDCVCAACEDFWQMTPPDAPIGWQPWETSPDGVYVLIELAGSNIPAVGYRHRDLCLINGEAWSTAHRWYPLPTRQPLTKETKL